MRKKTTGIILCTGILAVIFAGCPASSGKEPEDEKEEATDYKPLTFDNYGREIVVKEKPSNILTFAPMRPSYLSHLDYQIILSETASTIIARRVACI